MKIVLKQFDIKYKSIMLYYLKTNNAVEQFNKVLKHIFIKYLIS